MPASAPRFALAAAVLVALACSLGACSSEPPAPSGSISSEAAQKLILEREAVRDAAAARERALLAQVASLQEENADLRAQLGLAEESAEQQAARAAQYEAGLGKAVEELNRVAQAPPAVQRSYAPAQRATRANVSTLSAPWVQMAGENVVVSGKLWNSGEAGASGTLYVELLLNGQTVDEQSQPFEMGARTDQAWSATFRTSVREGTYSARVRMGY